jgi:alanine racemase
VRPTYVDIDLGAVAHNVGEFARMVAPSEVCVVVKADGYGHGDVPVAETALDHGASCVAVALVEEGVRLREAGVEASILVLSQPAPESAASFVEWGLTPTVYTHEFVDALDRTKSDIGLHVKVDTGMHRVGVVPQDLHDLLGRIDSSPRLSLDALWTHFPVADTDPAYTRAQVERFYELVAGVEVPLLHLANTAGAALYPEARAGMCRIGLGTYGLHPCDETRDLVDLRPAMRLVSQVAHVQRLPAGESPSYGRVRPLAADSTVVTVPVGYADGYTWLRSGDVLIGGVRHPLAGRVTMDQIVVDVGDFDVSVGDEVVLLGRQGDEEIAAEEWADEMGTIIWEVVCTVGPRVPRRYTG